MSESKLSHFYRYSHPEMADAAARLEARVETLENENVAIVESRDKLRARVEALEATDRWLALMAKESIEDRHRVPASAQREMVGYHCVFDQALNEKDACYDAACRRPHYIKAPTMPTTDYDTEQAKKPKVRRARIWVGEVQNLGGFYAPPGVNPVPASPQIVEAVEVLASPVLMYRHRDDRGVVGAWIECSGHPKAFCASPEVEHAEFLPMEVRE